MTFQEAQAKFAAIVQSVTPGLSAAQLVAVQSQLEDLLESLPNTAEFDPIVEAIQAVSPRLTGQVTQAVLDDLASRSAALAAGATLLEQTAADASTDARILQFDKPQLVAAALAKAVEVAQELCDSARAKGLSEVANQAQTLVILLKQMQSRIKVG
ncbi:MAG TPA: hypothetical protein VLW52_16950 [Opitutaceae bacterium]|nr:hypothetical protein [Opitutaceae bacterium]